jgi:predicted amidophosphoribosyltransferase
MSTIKIDENGIHYFGDYHPYRNQDGTLNSSFDAFGRLILDLKDDKPKSVLHFTKLLRERMKDGDKSVICIVPSHDPEKSKSGILSVAQKLITSSIIDGTQCVKRSVKINKLASGGSRSVAVHLRSIVLNNSEIIRGCNVILLDDVTTSGNSLLACKQIINRANPKSITMYAMGKTQR